MSQPTPLTPRDTRTALIATLGADFQKAIAPFKSEILSVARLLRGDVHRAAMRLLVERHGRRPSSMEQQLIVAALAELQEAPGGPAAILERVAERLNLICETLPLSEASTRTAGAEPPRRPLTPAPAGGCAGDEPVP